MRVFENLVAILLAVVIVVWGLFLLCIPILLWLLSIAIPIYIGVLVLRAMGVHI